MGLDNIEKRGSGKIKNVNVLTQSTERVKVNNCRAYTYSMYIRSAIIDLIAEHTYIFDLNLSKKASKNTRAIPTVKSEKNENFKKSSENKMPLVKVVANDPSYCSKFFLF